MIEQEATEEKVEPKHASTPMANQTRGRRQAIALSEDGDKDDKRSNRRKQDIASIPPSTRPTRASARNAVANLVAAEAAAQQEEDEEAIYESEKMGSDGNEPSAIEEGHEEEVIDETHGDNGEVETESATKRAPMKRGRKPNRSEAKSSRSEKSEKSDEESTSPVRKSARIARK